MNLLNNGQMPAMPTGAHGASIEETENGITYHHCSGLSKREHFAAMAMSAAFPSEGNEDKLAIRAVKYADALLAALQPCSPAEIR